MLFQGRQYLPYAIGAKVYNGASYAPNQGPVNSLGYNERDLKYQARREAMERRLKAMKNKNFISPDVGREI